MDDEAFGHITRCLVRGQHTGSLATLDHETGAPFASFVATASAQDGTPILLLSDLALHTQNLKADDRVSLLVARGPGPGDPMTGSRVTVMGRIRTSDDPQHRARFLTRHPDAAGYAGFGDFAFYRIDPETVHLVAGFGVIETRAASAYLVDEDLAADFMAHADGAVEHMNADHRDAIALYATALAGAEPGDWRALDVDVDGFDLADGVRRCRVAFDRPMEGFGQLRHVFKTLADRARGHATN